MFWGEISVATSAIHMLYFVPAPATKLILIPERRILLVGDYQKVVNLVNPSVNNALLQFNHSMSLIVFCALGAFSLREFSHP